MNLRLKTSIDVETKLNEIQSFLQVSSKAAVMRIAIAFSLRENGDPRNIDDKIIRYDVRNQNGADYNRYTIFGDDEIIYKAMMSQHIQKQLQDEEFFPDITIAHINRGIKELYAEIKMSGSKEKFLRKFIG